MSECHFSGGGTHNSAMHFLFFLRTIIVNIEHDVKIRLSVCYCCCYLDLQKEIESREHQLIALYTDSVLTKVINNINRLF